MAAVSWAEVDPFVAALERAHASGGVVEVADYLPSDSHPLYDIILVELLRVDLELCGGRGIRRTADELLARHPRLRHRPDAVGQLAFEEYRARRRCGEDPSPESFRVRYGVDTSGWPTGAGTGVASQLRVDTVEDAADSPTSVRPHPPPPASALGDPSAVDPAAGRRLAEALALLAHDRSRFLDYELVRELGAGAFARVYLARQPALAERPVVLKLAADLGGEPAILARLQHANVVPVYAVHRHGPVQAFCMPYYGTTTLADLLRAVRKGPPPRTGGWIPELLTARRTGESGRPGPAGWVDDLGRMTHAEAVVRLFARLASGLAYAHERGVLHLDLKPANVLVADDGEPMLLDFNLASDSADRSTWPAAYVGGTLPYMSPQRLTALLTGRPSAAATDDVYAFGLMFAEMLTGRTPEPPVGAADQVARQFLHRRSAPPPDVRAVTPQVSPSVAAVVAKCLAPDPARRYPSARELSEDLQSHLLDRPLPHAGNPSLPERARKWVRRHPRLAVAAAVGTAAAVVVAAMTIALGVRGRKLEAARRDRERTEFLAEFETARLILADPTADPRQTRRGMELAVKASERVRDQTDAELEARVRELRVLAGRGRRVLGLEPAGPPGGESPTPGVGHEHQRVAAADMDRRAYRSAIEHLLRATRQAPADPMGWFLLGVCRDRLGEPAEAAWAYTVVIALRPQSAVTHYRRGAALSEAKRWAEAIADFDSAARLDPQFLAAYVDRGLARRACGDGRGAEADFSRALEFPDPPTRVYFLRATVRSTLGDVAGAAADRRLGLTLEPTDELSWVSRGVAKLVADPAAALADFDAALKLNPDSAKALENKAHVLAERLHRTADAIRVLDHAVATNPDYILARAGRGVLHARLGDRELAVADANGALRKSTSPIVQYQAGCVYALTSKVTPTDRVEAIRLLGLALDSGFGADVLAQDPDLEAVRGTPEFIALSARVKRGGR